MAKYYRALIPATDPVRFPLASKNNMTNIAVPAMPEVVFLANAGLLFSFFYRQTSPDTSLPTGQPIALPVCGSNIKLVFLIACSFKTTKKKTNNKKQPIPSNGKGLEIKSRGSRRVFLYYRFQRKNLKPSAEQKAPFC